MRIQVEAGVDEWTAWVKAYNMSGQYDELKEHMDKNPAKAPTVFVSKD